MTPGELVALLSRGREHADEERVDVLAHSLQCAALLAERHPDDRELQLAGLVHDVGWILSPDGPRATPRTARLRSRRCSVTGSPGSSRGTPTRSATS